MYDEQIPEHFRLTSEQIERLAAIQSELDADEEIKNVTIDRVHPTLGLWPELIAVNATVWSEKRMGGGRSAHWLINDKGEIVAHAISEKRD